MENETDTGLIDWRDIDHVLLDMDGTLLDLSFDNAFWLRHVPGAYADKNGISEREAKDTLFPRMMELRGTLEWYSVDFWSAETGIDIVALKRAHQHEIKLREGAEEFLARVRASGRTQVLVTNAHPATVEIKFARIRLGDYFNHVVSSHDYGYPKEEQAFWRILCERLSLDPARCLFIDDTERVLLSAEAFGIGHLLHVIKPDSGGETCYHQTFKNLDRFDSIWP